jgi:clan AA aspartic protease (TIGR02281 family)
MILVIAAVSFPARGQSSLTQLENRVVSEYNGHYFCSQGMTSLTIRFLKPESGSQAVSIFEFGPSSANQSIPSGAFLLGGTVNLSSGKLDLHPLSWISQPPGYVMVGLSGTSNDGGITFEGTVQGGTGCAAFSISRASSVDTLPAPAPPAINRSPRQSRTSEIPLHNLNGVFVVPVLINGVLTLNFMVDSGASDVSIPADVVLTLMRTGTLRDADFLGKRTYRLADGSAVPSQTFRIRVLKVGDRQIENVTGSVGAAEGSLLLGQSFLSRFKSWSIDNQRRVLVLE